MEYDTTGHSYHHPWNEGCSSSRKEHPFDSRSYLSSLHISGPWESRFKLLPLTIITINNNVKCKCKRLLGHSLFLKTASWAPSMRTSHRWAQEPNSFSTPLIYLSSCRVSSVLPTLFLNSEIFAKSPPSSHHSCILEC